MAIRNYTSDMDTAKIFSHLQTTLAEHGAKQIMFDYADDGTVAALSFVILVNGRNLPVQLPARLDKALAVLTLHYQHGLIRDPRIQAIFRRANEKEIREHAYRVAWKNILDWVRAQMALLDIEMIKFEEVFLPYMVNQQTGKTYFETLEQKQFQLETVQFQEENRRASLPSPTIATPPASERAGQFRTRRRKKNNSEQRTNQPPRRKGLFRRVRDLLE